jgi:carboxypeptidase family protein
MKKTQITSQKMYQAIITLFATFNSAWSSNPAISAAVSTLTSLFGLLNLAGTTQKNATSGITLTKTQARNALIQMALAHSAAGVSYAASIGNTTLKGNSKLTESNLNRANDVDLIEICQGLYTLVNPFASSLNSFGANAATLLAFKNATDNYQPTSQLPVNARAAKKAATINVKAQISSIDTLLKEQIDTLMVQFKSTNTNFYNQYMGLRHTSHTSAHLKTVSIFIYVKTGASLPLENADIKLTSIKGAKRNKFSKLDGSQHFTKFKPDTYTITVSLPGYVTQTQTITATTPQKLTINFVMVAATGGGTTTGTTTPPATA